MNNSPIILWFRRDLRVSDNPALHHAANSQRPVIPIYIFEGDNSDPWAMGEHSQWWLNTSLKSLSDDLTRLGAKLLLLQGLAKILIPELIQKTKSTAVTWNRCYEPYAIERDRELKSSLKRLGVEVKTFNGSLLYDPWQVKSLSSKPLTIFSAFWRAMNKLNGPGKALDPPNCLNDGSGILGSQQTVDRFLLVPKLDTTPGLESHWSPGERNAQEKLFLFLETSINSYSHGRNFPGTNSTSKLSPHLQFGEISPRQIWTVIHHSSHKPINETSSNGTNFLKELAWREFSHHLLYYNPKLPDHELRSKFFTFPWLNGKKHFTSWSTGTTGYPIVDAGMRELSQTGFMHNRVRMITASFLIKHLLIDWRHGERWFWEKLVDANLASNSASWQWVAGCGADAVPYFRIFNPIRQGNQFDKNGVYVKHWLPELTKLPNQFLHQPWLTPADILNSTGIKLGNHYPYPIIDHKFARERALRIFRSLNSNT